MQEILLYFSSNNLIEILVTHFTSMVGNCPLALLGPTTTTTIFGAQNLEAYMLHRVGARQSHHLRHCRGHMVAAA